MGVEEVPEITPEKLILILKQRNSKSVIWKGKSVFLKQYPDEKIIQICKKIINKASYEQQNDLIFGLQSIQKDASHRYKGIKGFFIRLAECVKNCYHIGRFTTIHKLATETIFTITEKRKKPPEEAKSVVEKQEKKERTPSLKSPVSEALPVQIDLKDSDSDEEVEDLPRKSVVSGVPSILGNLFPREKTFQGGISNYGNICYLNSSIQILTCYPELIEHLQEKEKRGECSELQSKFIKIVNTLQKGENVQLQMILPFVVRCLDEGYADSIVGEKTNADICRQACQKVTEQREKEGQPDILKILRGVEKAQKVSKEDREAKKAKAEEKLEKSENNLNELQDLYQTAELVEGEKEIPTIEELYVLLSIPKEGPEALNVGEVKEKYLSWDHIFEDAKKKGGDILESVQKKYNKATLKKRVPSDKDLQRLFPDDIYKKKSAEEISQYLKEIYPHWPAILREGQRLVDSRQANLKECDAPPKPKHIPNDLKIKYERAEGNWDRLLESLSAGKQMSQAGFAMWLLPKLMVQGCPSAHTIKEEHFKKNNPVENILSDIEKKEKVLLNTVLLEVDRNDRGAKRSYSIDLTKEYKGYEVVAFAVHCGFSGSRGHYIACIQKDGKWMEQDDSSSRFIEQSYLNQYRENVTMMVLRKKESSIRLDLPVEDQVS